MDKTNFYQISALLFKNEKNTTDLSKIDPAIWFFSFFIKPFLSNSKRNVAYNIIKMADDYNKPNTDVQILEIKPDVLAYMFELSAPFNDFLKDSVLDHLYSNLDNFKDYTHHFILKKSMLKFKSTLVFKMLNHTVVCEFTYRYPTLIDPQFLEKIEDFVIINKEKHGTVVKFVDNKLTKLKTIVENDNKDKILSLYEFAGPKYNNLTNDQMIDNEEDITNRVVDFVKNF